MTAEIINYFRKREDIWKCAICGKYVDRKSRHVILEIHTAPPFLFVFHLFHYKDFLEILKNCILNKNPNKLRKLIKHSICDIREEGMIAHIMGFGEEFEEDMKEKGTLIKSIKNTLP